MEGMMRKFFDKQLGEILSVDKDNVTLDMSNGVVKLRQAEFRPDVFDQLHFPIALKGGFIDEMSMEMNVSFFKTSGAKVVIKNVFLVFGPHTTDWSYDHVHKCKTKLVDLASKLYELKAKKKPNSTQAKGGFVADMKKKVMEDMKKKFLGMLEVHISGIHFRYEDATTQASPFAAGFKVGLVDVHSTTSRAELRTSGEWKYCTGRHADPFFSQMISTRRISAYWDVGLTADKLFANRPVSGREVEDNFKRLNRRETFSACVVDKILERFGPEHRRRKVLEGPVFRERLDFHQYVLFPMGLTAHVAVNKPSAAMRAQQAPLKDADVIFEPVDVALDTEQVKSINALLAYTKEFTRQDKLFMTRPRQQISSFLDVAPDGRAKSSSSSAPAPSNVDPQRRREVVKAWWQHAFQGLRVAAGVPKSHLDAEELRRKAKAREEYVNLCNDLFVALGEEKKSEAQNNAPKRSLKLQQRIQEIQMSLPFMELLEWRLLAKQRRLDKQVEKEQDPYDDEEGGQPTNQEVAEPKAMPNTMQVRVHFKAFQAFFLVVAETFWSHSDNHTGGADATDASLHNGQKPATAEAKPAPQSRVPDAAGDTSKLDALGRLAAMRRAKGWMVRHLAVKAQVLDVRIEAVQKGRKNHRVARWLELGIGSVNIANCNVKGTDTKARQILSILPFEGHPGAPLCVFVGLTTLLVSDRYMEPGDAPLSAMVEPCQGVAAHLRQYPKGDTNESLSKLGFLRDYKDELGKMMTFVFGRVGQTRVLDYTPFRRRLMHFLQRGRDNKPSELLRRPSASVLEREMLVKLQRKVEKLTGKSDKLGMVEGVLDGVRGRMVDHYNSEHVLCKEVCLAPMLMRALQNGCPQSFHMQFHQLKGQEQQLAGLPFMGDSFGVLPWKVSMQLLPKAEFAMGILPPDHGRKRKKKRGQTQNISGTIKSEGGAENSGQNVTKMVSSKDDLADSAAGEIVAGMSVLKWGRNGKCKQRVVAFDEKLDAVVWKATDSANPVGVIPLSKLQDVVLGVGTPVLLKVRSPKLRAESAWSLVTAERTLDLQADSSEQRDRWVAGLKEKYKLYNHRMSVQGGGTRKPLPPSLEKRQKVYPKSFRSEQCALKSTYKKLQAVSALGDTLDTAPRGEAAGGQLQQAAGSSREALTTK